MGGFGWGGWGFGRFGFVVGGFGVLRGFVVWGGSLVVLGFWVCVFVGAGCGGVFCFGLVGGLCMFFRIGFVLGDGVWLGVWMWRGVCGGGIGGLL